MFQDQRGLKGRPTATSTAPDRRQSERYPPVEDQAWIGWWDGQVFRKSPATLMNIGAGGALLIAETAPPRRSTTWICLEGMHPTEWVESQVLEVLRFTDGAAEVRLAFCEVCPYSFFDAAVHGLAQASTSLRAGSWAGSNA